MRPARSDDFRLPDLRVVPTAAIVPHEQPDPQRLAPLVLGFRNDAVLRNPPIVAPLPNADGPGQFMVLDGANRSTAVRDAGLPHIVVQVVPYEAPNVVLTTWHHALSRIPRTGFEEVCRAVPGLEVHDEPTLHASAMLARREILAYAMYAGGAATVFRGGRTLEERNRLLNALVDGYHHRTRFYRTSAESFEIALERHPDVTTMVVFPHFQPAEVMELAGGGARLPAGITRHLIRWRALRVNVPIERLADTSHSLEEKNQWLREWMQHRWEERAIRFYEESTVLFDE
jgi:hypothetical protein